MLVKMMCQLSNAYFFYLVIIVSFNSIYCVNITPDMLRPITYRPLINKNVNILDFLNNPRIINGFYNCFMDTGKCSYTGKKLKDVMQELVSTDCGYCNDNQKQLWDTSNTFVKEHYPELYAAMVGKYDPNKILERYYYSTVN